MDCPILRIGLSGFSPLDHYRLGQCIAQAVENLGRRAVFIASGDLSHKLKDDGPYGFAPEGPEFDRQITGAMAEGDFLRFLTMDPALCDRGGGVRPALLPDHDWGAGRHGGGDEAPQL